MCFCIPVPRFLRQNRILLRIGEVIERFDLHALGFLILVCGFPLFQVLEHPTAWLFCVCVIVLLLFAILALCRDEILLDVCDLLVLAFLALQFLYGMIGKGRFTDALTVVMLAAAWFPARRFFEDGGEKHWIFLSSLSLLIVSAIGVGEYLLGKAELRWVDTARFGDIGGRVTSLFSNPNILAVYLLLCFPFSLWAIFKKPTRRRARLFYAATAILCALCIIFTWSRGAWLGLFLECFLFLLFHSKKSRTAIFGLLPAVLLSLPLLPHSLQNRLFSIGDVRESSNRYRLQTWRGTWKMLCEHPFGIGIGEDAWRAVYPHYAVSGTKTVPHAHNIFLQVMAEVGIIGLLLLLIILFFLIRNSFQKRQLAAFAAISGTLVMGTFDHLWYFAGMLLPFWTVLAFCSPKRTKNGKKKPVCGYFARKAIS